MKAINGLAQTAVFSKWPSLFSLFIHFLFHAPNQVQMRCIFSIFASLTYFRGISSTLTCLPCFRNTLFCFRDESNSALFLSSLCLNCKPPLC